MTQTSINYARVLYELSVTPESIKDAKRVLEETPQLLQILESPVVPLLQKEKASEESLKRNWQTLSVFSANIVMQNFSLRFFRRIRNIITNRIIF